MKISHNERSVLKILINSAKATDTEIAESLGITKQAIGNIRKKLEHSGIIRGYSLSLDYEKLGINILAILMLKFRPGYVSKVKEEIDKNIKKHPHLISVYRVPGGATTHIALCGFRGLDELDDCVQRFKTNPFLSKDAEIQKLYVFSIHSIMKDSPIQLFCKMIDEMGE